jgi:CMP-N,N'-diacetyllegionaminic acid synthase
VTPSIVALIPARAGSKRIPGKNTKLLGGKPLIQWTIEAAHASEVFARIYVFTEDYGIAQTVMTRTSVGVRMRSAASALDDAADIVWVREALQTLGWNEGITPDAFAILRPTSPFRTADTIRRAWQKFQESQPCDSLRAVRPVREHPGKMWTWDTKKNRLMPIMPYKHPDGTPWHSSPTQTLKPMYVQNASLEIAWTKTVTETGTISGDHIVPFFTTGIEGVDLNTPEDWAEAERLVAEMATA